MLFATMQEWEEQRPIVRAVNLPYQHYCAVEVIFSTIFYILELCVEIDENSLLGRRFLVEDFETVLYIMNDKSVKKHRLSIFVPGRLNENKEISVHHVRKIFQGKMKENIGLFVYDCFGGKKFTNREIDEKKLSKKVLKCIYSNESKDFHI